MERWSDAQRQDAGDADALWEKFSTSRDAESRRRLIEHYLPLARRVAAKTYRHAIQPRSFDDYLQYANVGLIEAVDRYDRAHSVPFEVYSKHRIRGAILSGVGQESEAAARREFARRSMPERLISLSSDTGLALERASLQDLLNVTLGIAFGVLLDRDGTEPVDEAPQTNPYAATELAQLSGRLSSLVRQLPSREREVISGHYLEHLEFKALAQQLSLSKGRISQLHGQALARLHRMLTSHPQVDRKL